jgi:3-hydroxyisobutyrate dehydrogenase-like beta-hydroxyacid dehydrogenase
MDHPCRVSLIGFGEAGSVFAGAAGWREDARGVDIRPVDFGKYGLRRCETIEQAVAGSPAVLSLVSADQSLIVAKNAAVHIGHGAIYFDMNSVAPDTKRASAAIIDASGGRYIDVAVMAPVEPQRLNVPLLISGPYAEEGARILAALGFTNGRVIGEEVGRASTVKMLRSVMYKGVEALTAECLIACERAGVTDEVLSSFGNDWSSGADYRLDRMLVHGLRRAAEMAESVTTLEALGVEPMMTRGTVERQIQMGAVLDLNVDPVPEGLKAKLSAVLESVK